MNSFVFFERINENSYWINNPEAAVDIISRRILNIAVNFSNILSVA